jgi:hypothetical protein
LYGLMVYDTPRIDVSKPLQCQAVALLLLVNPGVQRLFDDPTPGAFKTIGQLIDFLCKLDWHMGRENLGLHSGDAPESI